MDVSATLSEYGAAAVSWVDAQGRDHEHQQPGGQLEDAFDRLGREPLRRVLRSGVHEVALIDGALSVRAGTVAGGARLEVRWGDVLVVDEALTGVDPTVSGPGSLGSSDFRRTFAVRYAYVAGAMAGGIASADLVVAMQRAGLMGFYGAGGVPLPAVEAALVDIASRVDGDNWGANLLHNPVEPDVEERTVDLYLRLGVTRVSASAYVQLTPAVVRYRFADLRPRQGGGFDAPNHIFAKVSRTEVAEVFLRPPPAKILDGLVAQGHLTPAQAVWASTQPVATAVTAEADSGGHTDHRPLVVVLPAIRALRDAISAERGYARPPFVGAAGGIGTPAAVVGAFAMGADYVLTGSVNQASREAGTSDMVKTMLADASSTDVASGPAPDMFEMGAKVQVLSRGSMYARRAQRLYDLYKAYPSIEAIPEAERSKLERTVFARTLDAVWADTQAYWTQRDPSQLERAQADSRHRMALVFRWYLGNTSRWARTGDSERKRDFQVWCGPSMGAFNAWARGGPLHGLAERGVVDIAEALMCGAASR